MINGANTGFMRLAASLVMLMTPGLAFFYGGLVGHSNTLTALWTFAEVPDVEPTNNAAEAGCAPRSSTASSRSEAARKAGNAR